MLSQGILMMFIFHILKKGSEKEQKEERKEQEKEKEAEAKI